MRYGFDDVIETVGMTDNKVVQIFEGRIQDPDQGKPLIVLQGEKEQIFESLKKIKAKSFGIFTVFLSKSDKRRGLSRMTVDNPDPDVIQFTIDEDQVEHLGQTENESLIEARIRKQIENEYKLKGLEEQLQLKNLELESMVEPTQKLAKLILTAGELWIKKRSTPKATVMNGSETAQDSDDQLAKAFVSLAEKLGKSTIIQLANKVQADDPIIQIVKNYATS